MTIDSLDGHDGFNPAKGHIGCPLVPAMLSLAPENCSGADFLATMVMGYEIGARMAMAQHATAPDYHTSGSWGAVAGAAAGARLLGLGHEATRHALGIAEYHGPRSPMMRCIDFPTNVKDGSGWGALCGVSAVQLARRGFTGAPAITVEDAPEFWGDLGTRWYMLEQYFKPYPVCRWAQAPIEATLSLRRSHGLTATDVRALEIETFHESVRLHVQNPQGTDAAQYSTSFPCALALVYGDVQAKHLGDDAIANPAVLRLSNATTMVENAHANAEFPLTRLARVRLQLQDGTWLQSDWHTPRWDWQDPPSDADLRAKFDGFAIPVLGASKAAALAQVIATLDTRPLADLRALLGQPSS
jgi:2-methylcitrate dehydratase PrpD